MTKKTAERSVTKRFVVKKSADGMWIVIDRCEYDFPIRDSITRSIETLAVFIYRSDAIKFRNLKRFEMCEWYQSEQFEHITSLLDR